MCQFLKKRHSKKYLIYLIYSIIGGIKGSRLEPGHWPPITFLRRSEIRRFLKGVFFLITRLGILRVEFFLLKRTRFVCFLEGIIYIKNVLIILKNVIFSIIINNKFS